MSLCKLLNNYKLNSLIYKMAIYYSSHGCTKPKKLYTHTHIKYTNQDLVRRRGSKNESNYGIYSKVFPGSTVVKKLPANSGDSKDTGLIPGLGRDPGEGNGNPLQYSCLENPMDRGAWQAAEHGVAKSRT